MPLWNESVTRWDQTSKTSTQTSNINANIKHQRKHQTSNIKHQTSNIKHQTSNIKHQTTCEYKAKRTSLWITAVLISFTRACQTNQVKDPDNTVILPSSLKG
jgi:hypothetical protein